MNCNVRLNYNDVATIVKVRASNYANNKQVEEQFVLPGIFLQTTGFEHNAFQDSTTADAIFYPDPENEFVIEYANRLEGMYLIMQLYGSTAQQSWYKIEEVTINRDHLLNNKIDNIELSLKKTTALAGVS